MVGAIRAVQELKSALREEVVNVESEIGNCDGLRAVPRVKLVDPLGLLKASCSV